MKDYVFIGIGALPTHEELKEGSIYTVFINRVYCSFPLKHLSLEIIIR